VIAVALLASPAMKKRLWLIGLVVYLAAAAVDGAVRAREAVQAGEQFGPAVLAVAYCAGLFWPIDLVARPLLNSR
jgi:hypothetical protein